MKIKFLDEKNCHLLKRNNVYIYGAGVYAHDIKNAIKNAGVEVKAFIVDDAYIPVSDMGDIEVISLSTYRSNISDADAVINGMANVARFRQLGIEEIFKELYVYYEPVVLWKYDEAFWNVHKGELKSVNNLYADELSCRTALAFIKAKKEGRAEDDIEAASEQHTYFNGITEGKTVGAYMDCGAFNGDSVEQFFSFVSESERTDVEAFAFEPDCENYEAMIEKFRNNGHVHCYPKGISDRIETLNFDSKGNMAACLSDDLQSANAMVGVTDIDSVVGSSKIGFIKMDIEGSELKGLHGAAQVIKRDHPILAISAYHRQEDLIELPSYIKTFDDGNTEYKLYLRHHGICAYELVLYGIPEVR